MPDSLTTLIARVQAQLLDDATLFSTATVTAAVRQALRDFNQRAPINMGEIVEVTSGLLAYELTGGSFPTVVLDVLDVLKNDDLGEDDDPLEYDKIFEDNRVWIRLRDAEQSGNLLIRYTQGHTVNGLDSEVESTMNADQDQILVDGACGHAINIRLLKPIEAINLNQANVIIASYERAAKRFFDIFNTAISRYENRPEPRSEKRKTSWLDNDIRLTSSSTARSLKDL
jgi:hypothetical protein